MANVDQPRGLVPVNALGAQYCGSVGTYYLPTSEATNIAVGDPVKYGGSADSDGVPSIAIPAVSDPICGVVVGFVVDKAYEDDTYRTASTARYALVADDPNQLFVAQEDSDGGALTADDVGQNIRPIFGGTNTTTGMSGVELDSNTAAGTAAHMFKLVGLDRRPDNEIGTNADWIVKINNHQHGSHTGTVGA